MALDSEDNVYISALYTGEVEVFGPHQHGDVAPLRSFTTGGYPAYIRNDGDDHLYIQSGFSPQISEYDLNGQLLGQIQAPGNLSAFGLGNGLLYLPTWDGLNTLSVVRLSDHTTLYSFPYPKYTFWSASADERGSIFVLYEPPRPKHLPSEIRVYPPGARKPSRTITGPHTTLTSYGIARVGP